VIWQKGLLNGSRQRAGTAAAMKKNQKGKAFTYPQRDGQTK